MMSVLAPGWHEVARNDRPFPWTLTPPGQVFASAVQSELATTFPDGGLARRDTSTRTSGKTYRNWSRPAAPDDAPNGTWAGLLTDLLSREYRQQVAALLGQPQAADVELRFVQHARGDWLDAHVDSADKVFSHIFYFADGWSPEWGGCLELLNSADPQDVAFSIPPVTGQSVLMARTDHAWHQVSPVGPDASAGRSSLLVHGWR
ncbi:2OG-Fe(II) oxygenase family protein [Streptomyces sp. NBC_01465]|uniref:2OG-Fe(II) oxygenase family protein n=1 Tax=Streptomyces sp. NBC_01465 TaxID=2903878 RepID=UPI002E373F1F|nr:2OG-Fe(II) oxygenase family protein [Streptomyces sp. NBC_01465]